MAKNISKTNNYRKAPTAKKATFGKLKNPFRDKRFQLAYGFFLLALAVFLLVAFLSYIFTWKADQSIVEAFDNLSLIEAGRETKNWLGLYGAISSHYFIFKWFGVAAFFTPPFLFILGFKTIFGKAFLPVNRTFVFCFFFTFWFSLLFGSILQSANPVTQAYGFLSGGVGYQLSLIFNSIIGWGTYLFLTLSLLVFLIFYFNITSLITGKNTTIEQTAAEKGEEQESGLFPDEETDGLPAYPDEADQWQIVNKDNTFDENDLLQKNHEEVNEETETDIEFQVDQEPLKLDIQMPEKEKPEENTEPEFIVQAAKTEREVLEQENYDPTLDLGSYQYPPLELLKTYDQHDVQVSREELEQNKDKIIDTLVNFKIGITSIKATIGPTVTLYEIVPEAGVKISKIKNLEDDIALSLAALGIRIIAPIPGKGTIGIEVPNKNRELVSIRSTLAVDKFMKSDKELPIILGKTISNEVFVVDLTKMPHILIAGATGQGKSVGINVLLASLLYKKHPSQLKLILVDPKKVELSLFNKIERHFLAMLPDSEEAIITDTKKVVNTLNSLCIEMDNRYNLLKDGGARNLKEYNAKFVKRKLNPNNGHRFMPYIVLVIDELADLMMTAGKEVEAPIARLAQLARAIGIHLVVATQRPSVNVITGIIKANFPARISFRVTSKVDSRTILDTGGADQLIGMGDMLLSQGSEIIRLQCPFVDTPEIEELCEFIGAQRGYESAYMLPEFVGEDDSSPKDVDLADRDALFDEAARLIVLHQQGSTSLIQRKLKLGYNRAGRLIDQLEAAGIVGSFEGSKAREVLISDEYSLEQLLKDLA